MFYCSPNEELEELKLNWKAKSIQYLCIRITKKDIEKWSTYPLSLTDRKNAVKMTTPPCKKRQGGGWHFLTSGRTLMQHNLGRLFTDVMLIK
jgi:hypothetical protein